jgi:hypothetical protein
MDSEVGKMTRGIAGLLTAALFVLVCYAPAAANEPVSKAELSAIRAANPWLLPAEPDVELWLDYRKDTEPPIIENLGIPRQMGITFNPASFALFRAGRAYSLEWLDETKRTIELRDDTGKLARHSFGNGPVHGGSWYGYFSAGATRWVAEFDDSGRLTAEHYYYLRKATDENAGEEKPEEVMTAITWMYDDAFSKDYPCSATIDHSSSEMVFEIQFQFLNGRWMVRESNYYHDGELASTAAVQKKTFF